MSIALVNPVVRIHTQIPTETYADPVQLPLGDLDTDPHASRLAGRATRRWLDPMPTTRTSYRQEIDNGRYSSRCTWHKISYRLRIQSSVQISSTGRTARYTVDCGRGCNRGIRTGELRAPRGWQFVGIADDGPKICRIGDTDTDYHFAASDLIAGKTGSDLARLARHNAETRRTSAKLSALEAKSDPLVMVQDSLRAGNCPAGTLAFAAAGGIRADRHYSAVRASVLRRLAGPDNAGRVSAAIHAAYERETLVCI